MADPSELARTLESLVILASSYGHGWEATTAAQAERLLRELAADFDEYAEHGLDERGVACPKGDLLPRLSVACACGLDTAREKWRLPS